MNNNNYNNNKMVMNRGNNNNSVTKNQFIYRPFSWVDLPHLKILQNQLFPVQYYDNFYRRLLNESFITVLVWQKCNNSENNNNINNVQINNNIGTIECDRNDNNDNNNDNDNDINNNNRDSSCDDLQIEFKQDGEELIILKKELEEKDQEEIFINSQYELVGVATGRITKDEGLCSLFYQNYDGYLMTFGIKEQFRSKGIGSELLNNICKVFYKRGCDKVYLHVKKGNNSAYSFYIKNGFILDDEIVNYYKIDNIRYSALSMSKDLRPKERRSNWHSLLSLLKQTNHNFDDDDEDDEDVNRVIGSGSSIVTDNDINRKRFNFLLLIILILFLIVTLSLIAINDNNNKNKTIY